MLTPQHLRENARQNLRDARALLRTSPRNAAYLAGYAVEFVLKARYCGLRRWARFPDSVQELVAWNERDGVEMRDKLFVHDLEALLRLSDAVELKASTFSCIDWEQACDWSEHIRYQPADSVSIEDAEALIAEAEKVVEELSVIEVLQVLWSLEMELSQRYGPFHCFAFVVHPKNDKRWLLLVAWYAPDEARWQARAQELTRALDERLDIDLRAMVSEVAIVDPQHPMLQGLYVMVATLGGGIIHSPRSIFARNIVVGYPRMLDGYIITAGNWSPETVQKEWASAPALRPD